MARRDRGTPPAGGGGDILRFRTETGSVYEVVRDPAGVRWARTSRTSASGDIGLEAGALRGWPAVLRGHRATLESEPGDGPGRLYIHTSRVVEVLEGDAAEPLRGPRASDGLAAGDLLLRDLAGILVELPYLGTRDGLVFAGFGPALWWTFDADSGAEVDEDLGWGPAHGRTGSRLVGVRRGALAPRAAQAEAVFLQIAARAADGEAVP